LAAHFTNEKDYAQAKSHANKAQNNFKEYEMDNRIQVQIRSLQRKLKFLTQEKENKASGSGGQLSAEEIQKQKNFYIS
jgi:hypothetical protein